MPETIVGERQAIFESESKVFLRGVNYIDSRGVPRAIGFRGNIMDWINSADETGHFILRDAQGNVEEQGDIREVFYSASTQPLRATQIPISWQKYIVEGKPSELETKTLYYTPLLVQANV